MGGKIKWVSHDSVRCPDLRKALSSWFGFYLCLQGSKTKNKFLSLPKYNAVSKRDTGLPILVRAIISFLPCLEVFPSPITLRYAISHSYLEVLPSPITLRYAFSHYYLLLLPSPIALRYCLLPLP